MAGCIGANGRPKPNVSPKVTAMGWMVIEAGCKIVFTQQLKRSDMSWTIKGEQMRLDLHAIRLSRV